MKTKTTILYNNYINNEQIESAKRDLEIENRKLTEEEIIEHLKIQQEEEYKAFIEMLEKKLKNNVGILKGTIGTWQGEKKGGKYILTTEDLTYCLSNLDYIKIYDRNGHLFIEGSHHDGNNYYELKLLTNKGEQITAYNGYLNTETLHNKIFNNNLFSKLPHITK